MGDGQVGHLLFVQAGHLLFVPLQRFELTIVLKSCQSQVCLYGMSTNFPFLACNRAIPERKGRSRLGVRGEITSICPSWDQGGSSSAGGSWMGMRRAVPVGVHLHLQKGQEESRQERQGWERRSRVRACPGFSF